MQTCFSFNCDGFGQKDCYIDLQNFIFTEEQISFAVTFSAYSLSSIHSNIEVFFVFQINYHQKKCALISLLPYFFAYKTVFFSFQNNPKNLDLSYKMDLDLWDCLGKVKPV